MSAAGALFAQAAARQDWTAAAAALSQLCALAKKQAKKVTDCARKNPSRMVGVWKSSGRKGNTPPHTPVALTAKNSA